MEQLHVGDIVWLPQPGEAKPKMGILRQLTPEGYALVILPGHRTNSRHSCLATDLKRAKPTEVNRLWPKNCFRVVKYSYSK